MWGCWSLCQKLWVPIGCLNPYCAGCGVAGLRKIPIGCKVESLNPCFAGRWVAGMDIVMVGVMVLVLILVLLEDGLLDYEAKDYANVRLS